MAVVQHGGRSDDPSGWDFPLQLIELLHLSLLIGLKLLHLQQVSERRRAELNKHGRVTTICILSILTLPE